VKRGWASLWASNIANSAKVVRKLTRLAIAPAARRAAKTEPSKSAPQRKRATVRAGGNGERGVDEWLSGTAAGATGSRRYWLYRPAGIQSGERVPMIVMLHGCGQDASMFAASTRMNQRAARERFVVLYPEQDRLANARACWNWFDTKTGRAYGEAALIMAAVDQVCVLHPVDPGRVAVAGLSAGASMAALLVTRYPERFKAVVMHSGIPPGTADSALTALRAMKGQRSAPAIQATAGTAKSWPPLLVIHGTVDTVVDVRNGRAAAQRWAEGVGARATTERSVQRGKRYAMTVTDFQHQGTTVVTLADIGRLGHAWSGGAANQPFSDAQGPDASRMVWAFAARQFRR